ncbi:MAG: LacI family DNA-binding transcriptional regulator [Lentisphaeria bacterium]|nr:LacI family DNA-binding transcriptional regulator [Lentisphaeria bacterium]
MTIKDIAEHFGISISMVSRAINNSGYIREDLRKDIVEYARLHHWQPSKRAVSLKTGSSHTVGVVAPFFDIRQFDFIPLLVTRLAHLKYSWQFAVGPENEKIDMMVSHPVDMIFVLNVIDRHMPALENAIAKNIPVLNIFGYRENVPSVFCSHEKAIYNCMKTLALNGHHKIAYIGPDFRMNESDSRVVHLRWAKSGINRAVIDFNLDFDTERDCIFSSVYEFEHEKIKKLLISGEYTAFFGWTIHAEIAFYSVCRELGIVVGRDISFIGFEGEKTLQGFNPPPTYYDFDYDAVLEKVSDFVLAKGKDFPLISEAGFNLYSGSSICKI